VMGEQVGSTGVRDARNLDSYSYSYSRIDPRSRLARAARIRAGSIPLDTPRIRAVRGIGEEKLYRWDEVTGHEIIVS
jgi:hypothetical protein